MHPTPICEVVGMYIRNNPTFQWFEEVTKDAV
jgi:hypothetical protein